MMSDIHVQKNETGPLYYITDQKKKSQQNETINKMKRSPMECEVIFQIIYLIKG